MKWTIILVHNLNILTFNIWPFKCQISAVAGALFNLNAHSGTIFSLSDKKDIQFNETTLSGSSVKGQCGQHNETQHQMHKSNLVSVPCKQT
jgi:hypothetical protein